MTINYKNHTPLWSLYSLSQLYFPSWAFITMCFMYEYSYLFMCDRLRMRRNRRNKYRHYSLFWCFAILRSLNGFQVERGMWSSTFLTGGYFKVILNKILISTPLIMQRGPGAGGTTVFYISGSTLPYGNHTPWAHLSCLRSFVMFTDLLTPLAFTLW